MLRLGYGTVTLATTPLPWTVRALWQENDIQYLSKESDILFCSITHANLGQILKPGTDLESADPEVFKTPPTCAI